MSNRWISRAIVFIILVVIGLLLFPSIQRSFDRIEADKRLAQAAEDDNSGTDSGGDAPADAPAAPPADSGYRKIGESERLELQFRDSDSAIMVKDKTNGHIWRSAVPLKDKDYGGNDLWTASSQSIFHLTYTDPSQPAVELQETNSSLEQAKVTTEPLENGIMAHYMLPKLNIGFSMSFRLQGNALEVTIPGSSVKESNQFWLMTLAPLPFFGAAGDDESGYSFYPDGPGALSYFRKDHPQYASPYRATVFGPDRMQFDFNAKENAALPVFGMKVKDNAFLGIITDGEYDASILYSPSGYLINLNRVTAEFVYRRIYEATKKNGNLAKKPERDLIREDHTIRYVFMDGDQADYSHMASAYRSYLTKERGVAPRIKSGDSIPLAVDLLAGLKEQRILYDRFIDTTTFGQAGEILADLKKRGVERITANLLGWQTDGYLIYPSKLPPADQLGGLNGLSKLAANAKKSGVSLYLQDNFVDAYAGVSGFSVRNDVVREANSFPMTTPFNDYFFLNAPKANIRFDGYLSKLKSAGVTGINFEAFGILDYFDHHAKYPATREGTAKAWMEMMEKSRDQFGGAAVVGGNAYVLPYTDRLFDIPMRDSGYFFTDEVVPFYQMVVHGLIPYSGTPQNLFYDPRAQFLKMIEYGFMPYYQFTYQHSDDLKNTFYSDLFSSNYRNWVDIAVKQYQDMDEKLSGVWSRQMIEHRKLQDDVFQMTYDDGTRVIVNYNTKPVQLGGSRIPAQDYIVLPKEG